jgi:hypothetical protein
MGTLPTQDIVALGKILIAAMLVVGGIVAIFKGVGLFREGIGIKNTNLEVTVFNAIKIATSSVGGALMLTAAFWGWLANQSLPQYSSGNGIINVSDISLPAGQKIVFPVKSADLTSGEAKKILELADRMSKEDARYYVISTTSSTTLDSNESALSRKRANVVIDTLKKGGVEPSLIRGVFVGLPGKIIGDDSDNDVVIVKESK